MDNYYISIIIISIGIMLDSLHSLFYYKKYYSDTGLFSMELITDKNDTRSYARILAFLKPLVGKDAFYYILMTRACICLFIMIFPSQLYGLIIILFILQLLFNVRNKLGLSGADQMRTILLFGLSVMAINDKPFFGIGLLFIIVQLYISYFFTGYNKIKSPVWRNGNAMIWVLNSNLFGNRNLQAFIIRRGKLFNKIICWGVILFQLLFPLFGSMGDTVSYILFIGFFFHLFLAVVSNLNDFFWTYTSAYPLVYFFAKEFSISNYFIF